MGKLRERYPAMVKYCDRILLALESRAIKEWMFTDNDFEQFKEILKVEDFSIFLLDLDIWRGVKKWEEFIQEIRKKI